MNVWTAFSALCLVSYSHRAHAGLTDNSVHIQSPFGGQLVTSTTLSWVAHTEGKRPDNSVIATEEIIPAAEEERKDENGIDDVKSNSVITRPVFICRAVHNGILVPGQLRFGKSSCQISIFGKVYNYSKYQVLQNIVDSARLSWVKFSKFEPVPPGAVSGGGEESYVARRLLVDDGKDPTIGRIHLVGKIKKQGFVFELTFISQDDKEVEYSECEVLVETEPIRYDLTIQNFNNIHRKQWKKVEHLGYTVLRNSEDSPMHVDAVLAYTEKYAMNWGQGRAILTGLPTAIRVPNGTILEEIKWGIPENEKHERVHRVEAFLEPGTAVNVSLAGNQTITEIPYKGKLVAIYKDEGTRERLMTGTKHEESMKDLVATYSPAYFLSNYSFVPTTTTTTTTPTTTTTITTPSTTISTTPSTTPAPMTTKKVEKPSRKEENMINDQATKGSTNNAVKEGMTGEKFSTGSTTKSTSAVILCTFVILLIVSRIT